MAEGRERVEIQRVVQRQFGVVGEVVGLRAGLAHNLPVAAFAELARVVAGVDFGAVRYGAGDVAGFLDLDVATEVEEAVVRQFEALVDQALAGGAEVTLVPFALAILAVERGRLAATFIALEDDVDHPGNGIGTVLRGGAVAQHFNVINSADRDQVKVHRRLAVGGRR
ncbi:hypothetical protein D3C72_1108480 [compost metagenome]